MATNRGDLHSASSEKALLACILLNNKSYADVSDIVSVESFYQKRNALIYGAMEKIFGSGGVVTIVSLEEQLRQDGNWERAGGVNYLIELDNMLPSSAGDVGYANTIADYHIKRKAYDVIVPSSQLDLSKSGVEIIEELQQKLFNIKGILNTKNTFGLNEIVDAEYELFQKRLNGKQMVGVPWVSPMLNQLTGGVEMGNVYVFGGTAKSGKGKWVIANMCNFARAKVPVYFASLEMGRHKVIRWFLSHLALIDSNKLRDPKTYGITEEEIERYHAARNDIKDFYGNWITTDYRSTTTTTQLKFNIMSWMAKHGQDKGIVVLDFLQRFNLEQQRNESKADAIERTTAQWATICKDYNIAIVYLSQLVKKPQGVEHDFGDFKGSGGITENVDCAVLMNNYNRVYLSNISDEKNGLTRLDIVQRDGEAGHFHIHHDLTTGSYQDSDYRVQRNV
jgi:replicative DNA helicase